MCERERERESQVKRASGPLQGPGNTTSQGLLQAGGGSGQDHPAPLTPNLVQEELEGAALTSLCTFAAAWLHDSGVLRTFIFLFFYIAILYDLSS